jgi:hypothetical protein
MAMDVVPLVHVPPGVPLTRVVFEPIQTDCVPPIAEGMALTVSVVVVKQLVGSV